MLLHSFLLDRAAHPPPRWQLGRAAHAAVAAMINRRLLSLLLLPLLPPPCCSWAEWRMVLLLSAPVVLVDEALKLVTRR